MSNRIGPEVAAAAHMTRCIGTAIVDVALERVEITKRNEAVTDLLSVDAHAAATRMKRGSLRLKREWERRSVVVTRLRNDRTKQQADHIGRVLHFEQIGLRTGDAVFESGRAGYHAESLDSPVGGWLGHSAHRRLQLPRWRALCASMSFICRFSREYKRASRGLYASMVRSSRTRRPRFSPWYSP